MHQGCVSSHRCRRSKREQRACCRQRAASVADRPKPLKLVGPERVLSTTVSDLLANRWQTAVRVAPRIRQAGRRTRPGLLVCGGAPRRNRTGDPILTMDALCRLS